MERMMQVGFLAQAYRVRNQWEPKVRGVLTNAADALKAQLAPMIAGLTPGRVEADQLQQVRQAVRALTAQVAARQTAAALDLLKEMVGSETRELLEIMTINGVTQDIPSLSLLDMEDRELARRLAGGPPMEESVGKSVKELLARLDELLAGIGRPVAGQPTPSALLDKHLAWWRSRLAVIAATVTHAIFNRAATAACAALGRG
jgi:predicted NBD/HSP70 family sugar kinase